MKQAHPSAARHGWPLDEIPRFPLRRLRFLADVRPSNVDKKSVEGEPPIRLCNYTDVYYSDSISAEMDFMPATAPPQQIRRFELRRGDVLITKDSESPVDIAVASHVSDSLPHVVCGYHLALLRPLPGLGGRFLAYALRSAPLRAQAQVAASGITRFALSIGALGNLTLAVPDVETQRVIADFLDRETEKIDALVAKKQRLIELLREKRDALVSHAVSKGLDPDVPMKDSGIKWVRRVPEHWQVVPLKRISKRVDVGIAEAAIHAYADAGVPIVRSTNVRPERIDVSSLLHIEEWFAEKNRSKYLHAGDIVTVRTGNAGVSAVVPGELERAQCFTLLITTLQPIHVPEFVCKYLNSAAARRYFLVEGWGTAQTNISVPILQEIPVPIPGRNEQLAIAVYLRRTLQELDDLDAKVAAAIERLGEYRSALITAAVTGQIDVRTYRRDLEEALEAV